VSSATKFILLFFIFGTPLRSLAQALEPRESFAKAYASYISGNLTEAQRLFQRALEPSFPLADYSLYHLASISYKERDFDASRRFISQLRRRYPKSIWIYPAELQRAKMDLAEKKYTRAVETLRSLRNEKVARVDVINEAIYLQAQAQESLGDPNEAHTLYSELRSLFPHSRWTAPARSALARLREKYPDRFGLNTTQALADEADRLAREREQGQAETLYKKLLDVSAEPSFRLRTLMKLADVYLTARKRNDAIPILEEIARNYPETSEAPRALYQIGQVFWNRHDNAKALDYFRAVIERYPTSPYVARSRYNTADIYESLGRKPEAVAVYSDILGSFANGQVRDDATWRLAWLHYRSGEIEQAHTMFKTLADQATDGALRTAGLYWQGRSAERLGDLEAAGRVYQQIIEGAEESYYQALAGRALARTGTVIEDSQVKEPVPADTDQTMNASISFHFSRASELSIMSLHQLAVVELDEVDRLSKKLPNMRPLLMREYFRNHAYARSLAIANQLPGSATERNRYRFPLAYWEMIQEKARERQLDPYLILALIRQESLFDARARSPATALGLMQLLPSTAGRVAKQVGLALVSNEQLFQPEVNLTLGMEYLKDLLQRYSNNWFKAIAAYNAGEAAVDRWEKEILTDDPEEFVERIPYLETRGYVKLVMRNHRIYKRLYDQQR
jgi:soluble lytic murein transglycosylase-like protein/outer membrane protein assembly factor BamD (BamD/ComL family)